MPGKSSHGRCSTEKSYDRNRDQNVRPPAKNPSQRRRQSARIGHLTPLSPANCAIVPRFWGDGKVKRFHPRSADCKGAIPYISVLRIPQYAVFGAQKCPTPSEVAVAISSITQYSASILPLRACLCCFSPAVEVASTIAADRYVTKCCDGIERRLLQAKKFWEPIIDFENLSAILRSGEGPARPARSNDKRTCQIARTLAHVE